MEEVIETLSRKYKIILFGGGKSEIDILNTIEIVSKEIMPAVTD